VNWDETHSMKLEATGIHDPQSQVEQTVRDHRASRSRVVFDRPLLAFLSLERLISVDLDM
jgi:hypothetical protein